MAWASQYPAHRGPQHPAQPPPLPRTDHHQDVLVALGTIGLPRLAHPPLAP
ncbi:hypothetical protein [Streptomyces sp. NK08204]|uniref:hypothetical protein n=1 Tax=Streptomyces sp. NK08204 TaxID=2873260 RepID=UPI001CEC81E8|nr:hypothetical protein [Streptomyces sp. NK08204]